MLRKKDSKSSVRFELPVTEEMKRKGEMEFIRKEELRYERTSSFFRIMKYVFFTPLIKICDILTAVMKVIAGISVFGFFYGLYLFYCIISNRADVVIAKATAFCIFPFIAYFLVWLFGFLAEKMEISLD